MGASAFALTACDDSKEVAVFESVEQCMTQDGFTREACEAEFRTARNEHVRAAPKYVSRADCEADFGAEQCETAPQTTTSGSSVFMPLMMGYMMGNLLSGRGGVASQPLYRTADDAKNFRTADNRPVARGTGLTRIDGATARAPSAKTTTVRRGGFGATAAAYSTRSAGG